MKRSPRSACPIASSAALFGDRWTLIVLRDLFIGKSRFSEFLTSPERITTNILADRLAAMHDAGLVSKTAYQDQPLRYSYALTPKGEALLPVLQEICRWANAHIPGTWIPPKSFMARRSR